ncbi:hypothetical protein PoB_001906000 [Plakobranchus ocellatus]|uniref:Uncharacterized protein n=1 Tax=Plakobranchus ocellatus TaxID=259542 RepID=A0AAV3ZAK1_9GAST|nr:hypothetical protein PoB_001906000 [Plakobranchus ocellatus]
MLLSKLKLFIYFIYQESYIVSRLANTAEPGRKSHFYFELETVREGSRDHASHEDETQVAVEEKCNTPQSDFSFNEKDMPIKSAFGAFAKTKILEATSFFQGKKSNKTKGVSKDQVESSVASSQTNHNSVAGYDYVWPLDIPAKNTPHADAPSDCTAIANPDSVYDLAKPLSPTEIQHGLPAISASTSSLSNPEQIYHTPTLLSDHPVATLSSDCKGYSQAGVTSTSHHTNQDNAGPLYYLSTAVPVWKEPSPVDSNSSAIDKQVLKSAILQSSAYSESGINPCANRGTQGGAGQAMLFDPSINF